MSKEQRIIFTISKNKAGQMHINMSFHPKLALAAALFEQLPMYQREMQNMAAKIGHYVMKALADGKAAEDKEGLAERETIMKGLPIEQGHKEDH